MLAARLSYAPSQWTAH